MDWSYIPFEPISAPTSSDLEPGLRPTPMPTRPGVKDIKLGSRPTLIEKNLQSKIISLIKPGFVPFESIPAPTPHPTPIDLEPELRPTPMPTRPGVKDIKFGFIPFDPFSTSTPTPTNEGRVIIKYIRYSDGKVFEIPITLESGKMYPAVMKTIKLDHGEIQSPIGLSNEELIRIVEERIKTDIFYQQEPTPVSTVTFEEPAPQIVEAPTQQPSTPQIAEETPTTVKRSPVVFWVIIAACLVITFFVVKYFLKK